MGWLSNRLPAAVVVWLIGPEADTGGPGIGRTHPEPATENLLGACGRGGGVYRPSYQTWRGRSAFIFAVGLSATHRLANTRNAKTTADSGRPGKINYEAAGR